jgi:hypothetical protein
VSGQSILPTKPSKEMAVSALAVVCFVVGWEVLSYFAPTYAVPHWGRILRALGEIPFDDVAITIVRLVACFWRRNSGF